MRILFLGIFLLFLGCMQEEYNIQKPFIKQKEVSVVPFVNFTQTPLAGYRVAGILEGVLRSKGYKIKNSLFSFKEDEYGIEDINKMIQKAKGDLVITGYVNEFRYKTGIDGEPAVSVTIKVFSKNLGKYIYTSSFSLVGDTYNSLGVLTQMGFNEIIK